VFPVRYELTFYILFRRKKELPPLLPSNPNVRSSLEDLTFRFDGGDGGINISTVQHATRHVLAMSWVTLHHLVGWLKAGIRKSAKCTWLSKFLACTII
jgi:hypothetical protein